MNILCTLCVYTLYILSSGSIDKNICLKWVTQYGYESREESGNWKCQGISRCLESCHRVSLYATHALTRLTAFFLGVVGLPRWASTIKIKPIWILLKQETMSGSGISWAICKSAPCCRQITTPAPDHSSFLQAGCPSCRPTNSVKALKARCTFSGTTRVGRYQKGKNTNLDFTEARDSEWQWHQLGHMQVCISLQTENHASTSPLKFFTGRMPFLPPNQQRQSTEGTNAVCYCTVIL